MELIGRVGQLDEPSGREHLGDALAQGIEDPRRLAVSVGVRNQMVPLLSAKPGRTSSSRPWRTSASVRNIGSTPRPVPCTTAL